MARARNGEAISSQRRSRPEVKKLRALYWEAKRGGDLATWRRAKAVSGYLIGKKVIGLAVELDVTRGSINRWLQWYNALGADGLRTTIQSGGKSRLNEKQKQELCAAVEAGPQAAGFSSGMWTGPMVGDFIRKRFGISYHNHHVPAILHQLGFSVQRPRKRLARADIEAQQIWLNKRLPAIKKKQTPVEES